MSKRKKKPTNPPIEYIPVYNKQVRWIACREIAEILYHSGCSYGEIRNILSKFKIEHFGE